MRARRGSGVAAGAPGEAGAALPAAAVGEVPGAAEAPGASEEAGVTGRPGADVARFDGVGVGVVVAAGGAGAHAAAASASARARWRVVEEEAMPPSYPDAAMSRRARGDRAPGAGYEGAGTARPMRLLLAALCALATLTPALHAGAAPVVPEPRRKIYTPAEAAREMRAALKPPKPAPRKAAPKPRKAAPKAKPVARRVAPARRVARKPVRAWHARRAAWAGRRRRGRARTAPATLVRQPYEPPPPIFVGDLYVQAEGAPLWSSPAGGQLLGRLPKATIVTNMGRHGGYYKVEAPNGAVGFLPMRLVGPNNPGF